MKMKNENYEWKIGRRVVNFLHLASQLDKGCKMCGKELRLSNTMKERRRGLGSFLSTRCSQCRRVTTITTDTRHSAVNSFKKVV